MLHLFSKKFASLCLFACGALLIMLLLSLGVWQLERAAYKRGLEDQYFDNLAMLPLKESALFPTDPAITDPGTNPEFAFRQLKLSGKYASEKNFLIDNQIYKGQPGYRLVSVFSSHGGNHFLIDRGWLVAGSQRSVLPVFKTPDGDVLISGTIWPNLGLVPLLEETRLSEKWPKRLQRIEIEHMADILGMEVFPYLLRLEKLQPGAFTVLTQQVSFNAARHTGYAVQWFGLAITLFIGLIIFYRKQGK